ncbi:MAG: extracellular substrate binding-like orphan protein GrrP [Cyanobium sp.]
MAQARAEGVIERVARSGELVLVGIPDNPPLLDDNRKGENRGYAVAVARWIKDELSTAIGRPVKLRVEAVASASELGERIGAGRADLACGVPFTWARDMQFDFSLPIGLSGLRLLAPAGRFDGSLARLRGQRIAVVADSLAESELRGAGSGAVLVPYPNLSEAVTALSGGRVQGVVGDSLMLAGLAREQGVKGLALTPDQPYERYALACMLLENDSAFRNLVNLAIARLLQGYIDGDPRAVESVERWVGPGSTVALPPERIRTYFETVLLGVEAIRPLPARGGS